MIVEMQKFLIYGKKEEMDKFFELAQRGGFLEFIGMSHNRRLELPEKAKTFLSAIKIAKQHTIHPELAPQITAFEGAKKLLFFYTEQKKLQEEERILISEIARIAIFGNFSRKEVDELMKQSNRIIQFFCIKSEIANQEALPPELIYVGTDFDLDYFVSIAKEPIHYPKMIEIQIEKPVGELRKRLLIVQEEIAKLESDIRAYSNGLSHLQHGLLESLNQYHLELAKHDAQAGLNDSLFAIEAWVPATKLKALFGLLSSLKVQAEQIAIEATDRVPTCMENKGIAKLGEELVHVYDTPAPTDKDPSLWLLVFFSLFFAMIVSDTGYGLLYLSIVLFFRWKFRKASGAVKRFLKLGIILSCSCVAWGLITASYFGIEVGPNNPLRKTSFIHLLAVKKANYHIEQKDEVYKEVIEEYPETAKATNGHDFFLAAKKVEDGHVSYPLLDEYYGFILMELSLLIGSIHIILSLLRYLPRNWSHIGWVIFIIGGYLWFPKFVNATTMFNFLGLISKETAYFWGEQLLYGGLGLFCIIGFIEKRWGVFAELPNAVQIFSDILSYLRLYALALAGVVMAGTFNTMSEDIGFPAGLIVLLIGHMTNALMTLMGGVIHGLRLNVLEWYHYCFEGNGKLYNPLRILR